MNLRGNAAALWRRGNRARRLAPLVALVTAVALLGGFRASAAAAAPVPHAATSASTPIWSTQLDFDNNGTAWSESYFAGLAAKGLTTAELDMPWGTIEPQAGTFTFTEFDQELANAGAAGIQLIPIFWQAGWGGSPAPWITDFEVGSGGAQSQAPAWWDPTEQSEYFSYVTDTIANAAGLPGYGGAILDYGYLDAQWDLNGAGGGWAADDISEFQGTYLPQTYGTIAAFNTANGTSYSAFSQVPAAAPGQALAGVFQAFRAWSVKQTYGQLTADVRAVTASTPLYYYFGGGFGNATNYANNPDTFFQLAKQYNVAVIDDSAGSQGLTLTFASLARAYGVKLAQEWTAPSDNSQLAAQAVQWISNYAMGLPEGAGEDFFIHDGTQKDTVGYPIYTSWLPTLKSLSGVYPQQPAAVYVDFSQGYGNTSGGSLGNVQDEIGDLWLNYQAGFSVVTSQEVADGAVSLSQFKAVLPLNGVDANLTSYRSGGGTLLTQPEQLTQYTTAYAQIDSPGVGVLQTVPAVAANGTSASITLADISSGTAYDYPIAFSPAGLGLNPGNYYLVNAATGAAVPQTQQANGLVCASAAISAATLAQWTMVAGTPPAGTASASCPTSGTGAGSVSATAGQTGGGLSFLGVGQTNSGADGNLTQITQGGQTAVETWTTAQSGSGDANVYLQLDPLSAVEAAADVTVQVTYWATAGQGFVVQYDTPGSAYQNGPSVSSPGTGTWTTATVQLTGAQFAEAENGGADLRLNVTDASAPLIVQNVTMSVANSSSPTLSASPTSVSFGSQTTGSTGAAHTVTISNTGTGTASISSIGTAAPFAETNTCGATLAAGASCTASVTFTPSVSGAATGTLTVAGNATGSPLTVALSGTGTSGSTPPVDLALNQPVTASSTTSGYPAGNAVDGNTSSYWQGGSGSWPTTLTADLGVTDSISSLGIDLPPATAWSTRTQTLSVLGSADDTNWTTLVGSATYTWNPATGNTVTIALPAGTADRYVELDFTGNNVQNAAQVSEFQVFGTADPNLALNQPVTASSTTAGYPAANTVDGNNSSYWEGTDGSWPTTLAVNLGSAKTLGSAVVTLPPSSAWSTRTQTLSVLGSADGTNWTTLVGSATYTWNPATGNTVTIALPAGTTDQYLELDFTGNNVQNGAQVSELEVFG
ncbi:discoidin domain-containing protein [Streptacidiphilus sp. P02-A3a]|uniref:discoidin domain-containing protein n=1 Tax=Streptacidiphilus sp. P02-A3a TaxID=2704468 RepID=UPI0015FAAB9C|nr:discoidin domain-containing protein [Streptacidiphilus sp. P02-A3a]QMU71344.1 choice-of-anchor D domain-containing protein [Streptacidiphilus sp. P02-A3a]